MDLSFIYSVKAAVERLDDNELMTAESNYGALKNVTEAKKNYYLKEVNIPTINKFTLSKEKKEDVKPISSKAEQKEEKKVLKESEKSKRINVAKKEEIKEEKSIFKTSERKGEKEFSKRTGIKLLPKPDSIISLFKTVAKPYVTPQEAHLVELPTANVALKGLEKSKEGLRPTLAVAVSKAEGHKKLVIDSIDISMLNSSKSTSSVKSYKDTKIKEIAKDLGIKKVSGIKREKIIIILDDIIKYGNDKQRALAEKRKAEELEKTK